MCHDPADGYAFAPLFFSQIVAKDHRYKTNANRQYFECVMGREMGKTVKETNLSLEKQKQLIADPDCRKDRFL